MRHQSSITSLPWVSSEAIEGHIPWGNRESKTLVTTGETALELKDGLRTSSLVAITPCKVASVKAEQLVRGSLHELSKDHRREGKRPKKHVRD